MMIGKTNARTPEPPEFRWVLETTFNPNETYYERTVTQTNPSVTTGTYILLDKANIAPLRTSSYGNIYGNYSIGSGSGTVCFRLEQRRDTGAGVAGPFWPCYGFSVKNSTTMIFLYFRMDSGSVNGNDAVHTYGAMPDVIMNTSYDGEYNRSLISVFDSSVVNNLMDFLSLASVKVSDKIMGVDYDTREELLQLEGHSSITEWLDSITTYTKVTLTANTFETCKYFKKVLVEG